jgi:hypothetical protein
MGKFSRPRFVTITEQVGVFQAVRGPRSTTPAQQALIHRQVYVNASLATRSKSQDVSPPAMMGRRWAMKSVTTGHCWDALMIALETILTFPALVETPPIPLPVLVSKLTLWSLERLVSVPLGGKMF